MAESARNVPKLLVCKVPYHVGKRPKKAAKAELYGNRQATVSADLMLTVAKFPLQWIYARNLGAKVPILQHG